MLKSNAKKSEETTVRQVSTFYFSRSTRNVKAELQFHNELIPFIHVNCTALLAELLGLQDTL